jgi:hypothetical protein
MAFGGQEALQKIAYSNTPSMFDKMEYQSNTGCWNWAGSKENGPRPMRKLFGKNVPISHVSAWLWLGWKPGCDLWVLHKCDNGRCFNPKHLYLGSPSRNAIDSVERGRHAFSRRTHCKNGHEYTPENTKPRVAPSGRTVRGCKSCLKIFSLSRSKTHRN